MSEAFAWFHHDSDKRNDPAAFYRDLLGWGAIEGPGGHAHVRRGEGALRGLRRALRQGRRMDPFVQVADLDVATDKARQARGRDRQGPIAGPAGRFSVLRDPSGAAFALWQKA